MKILILTEGGRGIGFGHVGRCSALYEAFKEKGMVPDFIIQGDSTIKNMVAGKRYKISNWHRKYLANDFLKKYEVIVVDSYSADSDFYKNVAANVRSPLYIDDTKRISYPRGTVLNGALCASRMSYPDNKDVRYLLGSKYVLLRKEFWNVPLRKVNSKINNIFVAFGGDDARNMVPNILKLLSRSLPLAKKTVIIGRAFINTGKIKRVCDKNTRLVYYPNARKIRDMMTRSDIAISAGGQTVFELARVGVPTIVVATADNQLNNIKGLAKERIVRYVGKWNSSNIFSKIIVVIKDMEKREVRKDMRDKGRRVVDGKGCKRVVTNLLLKT